MKLLNIIRFNNLNIVWMPSETFCEYSVILRRLLGENTLFLGTTNGITGYLPTPFDKGGYMGEGFYDR